MAEIGLPLCIHGEVTTPEVDIFDREQVFLDTVLDPLRRRIPGAQGDARTHHHQPRHRLRREAAGDIAGTITTHHLMINRNHMLVGGIRPHYYCLPVAKRSTHQQALRRAAISGNPRFFLGTDQRPPHRPHQGKRLRLRRASSRPPTRCRASPMSSRRKARSTGSKASPPSSARPATACRPTTPRSRSKSATPPSPTPPRSSPAQAPSPSSTRATRSTGTSWPDPSSFR